MDYIKTLLSSKHNDRYLLYIQKIELHVLFEIKSSFSLQSISSEFVLQKLLSLPSKSSFEQLDFDLKLLHIADRALVSSLTHLFNLSIINSELPDKWKSTPIYKKKGSVEEVTNYRPISILPTLSKFLESAMKEQVVTYLSDNKLICDEQSTCPPGPSTQTSLHCITDPWNSAFDSEQIVATCSLNLAKGFDTISHHIFLTKLKLYGFSPSACWWFTSYLSHRTQKVKIRPPHLRPITHNHWGTTRINYWNPFYF